VVIGGGGGRLTPMFPRGWHEPRIIRPRADAPLAYKQASFLLPTMRPAEQHAALPGTFRL